MATFALHLRSEILEQNTVVHVILPDYASSDRPMKPKDYYDQRKKFKVLWLLHGRGGDSSDWMRKTSIERYALERKLAVIMPDARNSWYADIPGYKLWTFLEEELMPMTYAFFPLSEKTQDNYIAGLSMGGLGAAKWAINSPHRFRSAAVFSGALFDIRKRFESEEYAEVFKTLFPGGLESVLGTSDDLYEKTRRFVERKNAGEHVPNFYISCGTEDELVVDANYAYKAFCDEIGFEATWVFEPGAHTWDFWDRHIQRALDFFDIKAGDQTGD
ncbi:MAG: alpha/beta hydrolase [Christensenellales bacterium]|jgi:putative tributyrin esterase